MLNQVNLQDKGFTLKLLASINALVALPVCKPAMPDYDAISGQ